MKKEFIFPSIIICFILLLFFHKVFISGFVPFPGDLLINEYTPWKYEQYLGYNPGSYPTKFQYFDVIRQLYPWKTFVIDQLKTLQIPFWNPYNFSGTPLLANSQSQVFSPFNLLYFMLPYIYGWTVSLILQIALAFLFTYLYIRKITIGKEGAVLAATAFSCSLYMAVFFEYGVFGQTILWLPLILSSIEDLLTRLSVKRLMLLIFSVVAAAFGGHLQIFAYLLLFAIFYAIVRLLTIKKDRELKIVVLIFSFLISVGIFAIQLLPSLELIGLSARAPHDQQFFLQVLLLKVHELILFLAPDFFGNPVTKNYLLTHSYPQTALYIGIIPLIFSVSVLFIKKNNWIKFYLGAVITLLLFITLNPVSSLFYSLQLPFISSSSPTNAIFLLSFSLSVIAGFAFDQWLKKMNKTPLFISTFFLGFLSVIYFIFLMFHFDFNNKNVLYSLILIGVVLIIFIVSSFVKKKRILFICVILFTIFDLFYFFQKFNPFVPRDLVYPDTKIITFVQKKAEINRVWGYANANMQANVNIVDGLFSPDGYDPLYLKRYGELMYASTEGGVQKKLGETTRSNAALDSSLGALPGSPSNMKVMNLLGVKYIVDRRENGSTEKTFPSTDFKSIYERDGWQVFENKQAVPRVFLTSEYNVYKSDGDFEKLFFSPAFDSSTTILLEERPTFLSQKNNDKDDSVKIINYHPNKIVLQTFTDKQKLLFISDAYYSGWQAYVDGREAKIIRADYAFRAIQVPQGSHMVEFIYNPSSFSNGLLIATTSLALLFVVIILIYMRKLRYAE